MSFTKHFDININKKNKRLALPRYFGIPFVSFERNDILYCNINSKNEQKQPMGQIHTLSFHGLHHDEK